MSCLWSIVDVATLILVVGKLPKVSQAIARAVAGVAKFFEESAEGRGGLKRLRNLLEKLKKGDGVKTCPVPKSAFSLSPQSVGAGVSAIDPKDCNLPDKTRLGQKFPMPEWGSHTEDSIRAHISLEDSTSTRQRTSSGAISPTSSLRKSTRRE
ncbi:hypothetical protein [Streptomyces violascens]|uniref:hypothetical protein n=1 Tax=Streptomyces violascens TaxID=67381 RepID=UPI0016745B8B|nr:hypothetical protein [Streptomyces violascens]GGU52118.1 hypothetical protein GCM10010289_85510 [Streptomyces violascens]